jgi:hypothetical protein
MQINVMRERDFICVENKLEVFLFLEILHYIAVQSEIQIQIVTNYRRYTENW